MLYENISCSINRKKPQILSELNVGRHFEPWSIACYRTEVTNDLTRSSPNEFPLIRSLILDHRSRNGHVRAEFLSYGFSSPAGR